MSSSQDKARKRSTNLLFIRIAGPIFSLFMFILVNFEVSLEPVTIRNIVNILIIAFLLITAFLQSVTTARLFNNVMGLVLLLVAGLKFANLVPNKYYTITVTELVVYCVCGLLLVSIANLNRYSKNN
ncbi:MAG: hypothetical protein K2Q22_01560 [Cytophagales bacterium]|nr:hypothetical protein [Cytophagales bacterium]